MLSKPNYNISRNISRKIRKFDRLLYPGSKEFSKGRSENRETPRITSFFRHPLKKRESRIFEKYPLDITWPNLSRPWLPIESKGCGTSGSARSHSSRERERGEGGIRVSRSTRIIGSVWKQANPLIETLPPPRRFNHLSRIPIYVTVIKGGGAQTSNPKFR